MKPSMGRIVRYVNEEGVHLAAIVTYVYTDDDECVDLTVFQRPHLNQGEWKQFTGAIQVAYSEDFLPNSWHWPPREA
jgi:hypothetical protein